MYLGLYSRPFHGGAVLRPVTARYTARMPSRTLWLWLFVGSLGVTALLGMFALLLPRVAFEEELLGTSALLTAYSLAGLMASVAIARSRFVAWAWAGTGLLAVSLAMWLLLLWGHGAMGWEAEELVGKSGGAFTVLGVLPLHASLLLLARFEGAVGKGVRWLTFAAACGAGLLLISVMWEMWDWLHYTMQEWVARFCGALALPAALGTIAVPIIARIEFVSRRESLDHSIGRFVPVRFRCPRCQQESDQAANPRFLCPGCGLEARVTVAEPRCVCGYLLHGLPEPVCPECGRAVEDKNWWRPKAEG